MTMELPGMCDGETMASRATEREDQLHELVDRINRKLDDEDAIAELAATNIAEALKQRIYSTGIPEDLRRLLADKSVASFRALLSAIRAGGDAFKLLNGFLNEMKHTTARQIYNIGMKRGRGAAVGPSGKSGSNRETNWGSSVYNACEVVSEYLRRLAEEILDQDATEDQRRERVWKALTTSIGSIFRKVDKAKRPYTFRIAKLLSKPLDSWKREDTRDFVNWVGIRTFAQVKAPDGKALTAKAIAAVGLDRSAFDAVNRLAKADKGAGSGLGQKTTTGGLNLYGGKTVSNASSLIPTLDAPTTTAAAAPTCPTLVGSTTTVATDRHDLVTIALPGGVPHPPRFNPAAVEPTTTIESPQPEAGPAPGRRKPAAGSKPRSAKRPWRPDPPPGIDAPPPGIDAPPINRGTAALHYGADTDVVENIAFFSYKEPPPKMRLIAGANIDPKNHDSWVATAAGLPTGQPRGTAI